MDEPMLAMSAIRWLGFVVFAIAILATLIGWIRDKLG